MAHLDTNHGHILVNSQHGFRRTFSCKTQQITTIEEIAKALDYGKQTDLTIMDFSKAFDVVPHQRLINKLDYYGIRGCHLQYGRTHVTHTNLVYDLAHHESPIAQWLERPTGIWKVMGSTPVGGSENSFSEYFDLRTLLHYLHFIQVTNPFIIYSHLSFRHVEPCSMAGHMSHTRT